MHQQRDQEGNAMNDPKELFDSLVSESAITSLLQRFRHLAKRFSVSRANSEGILLSTTKVKSSPEMYWSVSRR